jgi:molybdopterin molybdotransferase
MAFQRKGPLDVRDAAHELIMQERISLASAVGWLERHAAANFRVDRIAPAQCLGRRLAASLISHGPTPRADKAAIDGHAVIAAETIGATTYAPIAFRLVAPGVGGPMAASPVESGEPMPSGADAVVPPDVAEPEGPSLLVQAAVAAHHGVIRSGQALKSEAIALSAGRRIGAVELALIRSLAVAEVSVIAPPRVSILSIGSKSEESEAVGDALAALIGRDGGRPTFPREGAEAPQADLALVIGRSGASRDDRVAKSIRAMDGQIERYGVAMAPGGATGLGVLGSAPLILLPGDLAAALVAYELLAGGVVRRMAGGSSALPFPKMPARLARKISSAIGVTEWIPVSLYRNEATPIPIPDTGGIFVLGRADGFILAQPGLEGYGAGSTVDVFLTAN